MHLLIYHFNNENASKIIGQIEKEFDNCELININILNEDYIKIKVFDKDSAVRRVINFPRALQNLSNFYYTKASLEVNGIQVIDQSKESIIKFYDVLIFDMNCISVKTSVKVKGKQQEKYYSGKDFEKISEIAKKSLYFMGLDYGTVTVVLTGKRRLKILKIDPCPNIRKKDLKTFINFLDKLFAFKTNTLLREVKLGADPEFMLFNSKNSKLISASNIFPQEGIVGCDNIRIPNRQLRPIAELRPEPNTDPRILLNNIKIALQVANKMAPYRNVKWLAGSQPTGAYSTGGHIHFSNIELNNSVMRSLDNYLAIPIFLIENPNSAASRRKKYGYLSEYRMKNHGGFEYRTPGSWILSEKIAIAVLCLAKLVVSNHYYLEKNFLLAADAHLSFYQGNQDYFRNIFDDLWSELEKLPMYNDYKNELELFPTMIREELIWDEKADFRKAWKIAWSYGKSYGNKKVERSNSSSTTHTPRVNENRSVRNTLRNSNIVASSNNTNSYSTNRSRRITIPDRTVSPGLRR